VGAGQGAWQGAGQGTGQEAGQGAGQEGTNKVGNITKVFMGAVQNEGAVRKETNKFSYQDASDVVDSVFSV
jgi:hypothetical protein